MFSDKVVEVKILDFLHGNCPWYGCSKNENGECATRNLSMRSDILEHISECIKLNVIPTKKFFYCSDIKQRDREICICGSSLLYENDDKNFEGQLITGAIQYCPKCDRQ